MSSSCIFLSSKFYKKIEIIILLDVAYLVVFFFCGDLIDVAAQHLFSERESDLQTVRTVTKRLFSVYIVVKLSKKK